MKDYNNVIFHNIITIKTEILIKITRKIIIMYVQKIKLRENFSDYLRKTIIIIIIAPYLQFYKYGYID
jgi:hypothetical protein